MDLPPETLIGLKFLGSGNITLPNCKRIIESAFQLILEEEQFERVNKICPEKREVVEQAYASFLAFIVCAIQFNADEETIKEYLTNTCNFKDEIISSITNGLSKNRSTISKKLSKISSLPPKITDCNWRLDFVLKSSIGNNVGRTVYLLVLTTEKAGKIEHLRFTCDQYQLQDLNIKLKNIIKQAETFAS